MAEGWDGVVVPSKLYGALQTDAPILLIGPERSDTAMEIRRYGRGMVLPNGCGGARVVAALDALAARPCASNAPAPGSGAGMIADFIA